MADQADHPIPAASSSTDTAPFFWNDETASKFPPAFVAFLKANDIHPDNYAFHDVPRYVRVNPRHADVLPQREIERQLGVAIEPVSWLPGYYCVPSNVKIAGCAAYQTGQLYGIDVSSGAAVAALDAKPGDDVLDLCCAPGAKLCAIADCMQQSGTLTGVDVNKERLAACRTLCTKYKIEIARLVLQDGSTFQAAPPRRREEAVAAPSSSVDGESGGRETLPDEEATDDGPLPAGEGLNLQSADGGSRDKGKRGRGQAFSKNDKRQRREPHETDRDSGPFFLGSALMSHDETISTCEAMAASFPGYAGYDKVIVDAECTHDGSIKHLAKFAQWGWDSFERRFLEPARLETLSALQLSLLRAGFRALKPGGTLVYSTCSFARAQNEGVVEQLLGEESAASLVPVEGLMSAPCREGGLPHTLRFEPRISRTSGLFIARLAKKLHT